MLNSKSIGNKISAARKSLRLSQAEVAEKVAISPQAVGKWERGESLPDITTLSRLAEILGVDLNYFSDNFSSTDSVQTEHVMQSSNLNTSRKNDWNWDMSRGNWKDADFSGLKNLKEKFSSSNIQNSKFLNSDLSGLMLSSNNIESCDFTLSNLRESTFRSSNLSKIQFAQCSFIDSSIVKSNVENCDFSGADFSGTELIESNLEKNLVDGSIWRFTKFYKSNLSKMVFSGDFEDCHFENCSFYNVKFQNAILRNTFFKYNDRFKKVEFENCQVDTITFAFLKNNQANLEGIRLIGE